MHQRRRTLPRRCGSFGPDEVAASRLRIISGSGAFAVFRREWQDFAARAGTKSSGTEFLPGVVERFVMLFQKACELLPIEAAPACAQAGQKLQFAACENRHAILPPGPWSGMTYLRIVIPLHFILSRIFSENRHPLFRIMLQQAVTSSASGRISSRCRGRRKLRSARIAL